MAAQRKINLNPIPKQKLPKKARSRMIIYRLEKIKKMTRIQLNHPRNHWRRRMVLRRKEKLRLMLLRPPRKREKPRLKHPL